MSYVATSGLTQEQEDALYDIDPADLRKLDTDRRIDLALQHSDFETRKKEAFWNAVTAFATGAIPILALFGLTRALR